ncbi:RAD52 motif-containing protein 1-like isoform X5 [Panulirus ornatus]|uniref:RAD52 motif-containing protein 1-like isoform X5 n=1 Tax=Panulirus ornatus TaxID=150431 RepID=UPI003A843F69
MDIEMIPFEAPQDEGHQVYLPWIKWNSCQEHLEKELEEKFSQFGLLHRVVAHRSRYCHATQEESENIWFAYVIFYSTWDFNQALQQDGKMIIGDSKVRIKEKRSNRPYKKIMLPLYKAQELLTYYFGFNCWTSKVVYLEREREINKSDTLRYICMVRVRMPREELCSEGVGIGEALFDVASPISKGCSFTCAQRFAFYSAMQAAFSKFNIIRLRNGKITAEVDTTQCDPLVHDPAWDRPLLKVNDINYNPENEEECEDLEDITEEQLEALLDVTL